MKIMGGLLACALWVASSATPALAQEQVTIVESCTAVDHFPANPVSGAPSLLTLILVLNGFNPFIGQQLTANVTGASGDVSGSGIIDMHGVVAIPVPLYQYGAHEFSNFAAEHPGFEHLAGTPEGGTLILVYVDDSEPTCDEDAMRAAAKASIEAAEATTTTTTTTTTSPTTSTSTTTTSTTTTTTTTAVPATTEPPAPDIVAAPSPIADPGGSGPLPGLLIGIGTLLALLGGWMLMRPEPARGRSTDHG